MRDFVIKETTIRPNNVGRKINYIVYPDTVVSIFRNDRGELLCVKQYRPVFKGYFVEFPGGSVEGNETVEECGAREFTEETGFEALEVKRVATVIPSIGLTTEKIHVLLVNSVKEFRVKKSEHEIALIWLPFETVVDMIASGDIVDAKTIIGTFMAFSTKFFPSFKSIDT